MQMLEFSGDMMLSLKVKCLSLVEIDKWQALLFIIYKSSWKFKFTY